MIRKLRGGDRFDTMAGMRRLEFFSTVWKEDKYYVAQCLNIDVSSFGKSKKEALENLDEAVGLYVEDHNGQFHEIESPSLEVRELRYA